MNDFLTWAWKEAVAAFTGVGVLTAIGWLPVKSWLKTRLEESIRAQYLTSLESHKAELKRQNDTALEAQKHEATTKLEELKAALNARFNERLQELRTEQDRALRLVQSGIDRNVHRAKKLYDREFEVISEGWQLLDKAWLIANVATSDRFDLTNAEEKELADSQAERFYQASGDLDHFVAWNGIFLTDEIAADFERLSGMLRMAFVATTTHVYDNDAITAIIRNFRENGEPIKTNLRRSIRERFWSAGSEVSGS